MIEPKFAIKTVKGLFIVTEYPPFDTLEEAKRKRSELNDFDRKNFFKVIQQQDKYFLYKLKNKN
jgi:hypothetical protein